jgi:protein-disulfide isomerase
LGEELDVQGTPTFFVDGRKVETTLPALSAAIEEVLAKMKTIRL